MPHGAVGFVTGLVLGVAAVGLTAVVLAQGAADERVSRQSVHSPPTESRRGSESYRLCRRAHSESRSRDAHH
jgi:hypothetical protein